MTVSSLSAVFKTLANAKDLSPQGSKFVVICVKLEIAVQAMLFTLSPQNPLCTHSLKILEFNGSPKCQGSVAVREGHCLMLSCHYPPRVIRDAHESQVR